MRQIKRIIVHCSATPAGRDHDAADIRRWHQAQGWIDIGYHAVVKLDGTVEPGRDPDHDGDVDEHPGAHVYGHNADTLAVVYVGGIDAVSHKPMDTRTPAQRAALLRTVRDWMDRYGIKSTSVLGHYELDKRKACPSFSMPEFRAELTNAAQPPREIQIDQRALDALPVIPCPTRPEVLRLQDIVGVVTDGWIGPQTYRAIVRHLVRQETEQ